MLQTEAKIGSCESTIQFLEVVWVLFVYLFVQLASDCFVLIMLTEIYFACVANPEQKSCCLIKASKGKRSKHKLQCVQLQGALCHTCTCVHKQNPLCMMHWQQIRFTACASQEVALCWQNCVVAVRQAVWNDQLQSRPFPGRPGDLSPCWGLYLAGIFFTYGKIPRKYLRFS